MSQNPSFSLWEVRTAWVEKGGKEDDFWDYVREFLHYRVDLRSVKTFPTCL